MFRFQKAASSHFCPEKKLYSTATQYILSPKHIYVKIMLVCILKIYNDSKHIGDSNSNCSVP